MVDWPRRAVYSALTYKQNAIVPFRDILSDSALLVSMVGGRLYLFNL